MEFVYLAFTRMPGKSYRRRLGSWLLCSSNVCRTLTNSLVCWLKRMLIRQYKNKTKNNNKRLWYAFFNATKQQLNGDKWKYCILKYCIWDLFQNASSHPCFRLFFNLTARPSRPTPLRLIVRCISSSRPRECSVCPNQTTCLGQPAGCDSSESQPPTPRRECRLVGFDYVDCRDYMPSEIITRLRGGTGTYLHAIHPHRPHGRLRAPIHNDCLHDR